MPFANPAKIIPYFELQSGLDVADFGAGDGAYTIGVAEKVSPSGKVYAVDVQKELLQRLKNTVTGKHLKNVEYIWGDFEKPGGSKLADGQVSFVLLSNVLFLSQAQFSIAREIWRVLRTGGTVAVIDWVGSFGMMGPREADVVTEDSAKKIFEQAGFQFVKTFPAGEQHYGIIFKK